MNEFNEQKDLLEFINKVCVEKGWYYAAFIDNGRDIINGRSHTQTGSRLDKMADAANSHMHHVIKTVTSI